MQSSFQVKISYTMAVGGLLDGGTVMVGRMKTFVVASEMGRGGVSVVVMASVFANSSADSLPGMPL